MPADGSSKLRLDSALDLARLRQGFAARKRIQILNFLEARSASALRKALLEARGWRRIINGASRTFEIDCDAFSALPADQKDVINSAVLRAATTGFQFRYEIIRAAECGPLSDAAPAALGEFSQLMNAPETLSLLRQITSDDHLAFADAQATRYQPGDFLTRHDDNVAGKDRRIAYVLGLTPNWRPEWGGLLLFNAPEGTMLEAVVPQFGALALFAVPQPHSVSFVAAYAGAARLSVTGWLRTRVPG